MATLIMASGTYAGTSFHAVSIIRHAGFEDNAEKAASLCVPLSRGPRETKGEVAAIRELSHAGTGNCEQSARGE